jgi:hypothetical protein
MNMKKPPKNTKKAKPKRKAAKRVLKPGEHGPIELLGSHAAATYIVIEHPDIIGAPKHLLPLYDD